MLQPNSPQIIAKQAMEISSNLRSVFSFLNARTAFKVFLLSLQLEPDDEIWLPAYIGWSRREGSGVFDPVQEVGIRYRFYRVTDALQIDQNYLVDMFRQNRPKLLMIIHYFGFPDPNLQAIVELAKTHGTMVLEDEAHALYSDWIGYSCGRYGAAAIMSLHKMLPYKFGGLLLLNKGIDEAIVTTIQESADRVPLEHNLLDYDLAKIARARRENAEKLLELLQPLQSAVMPLYPSLPENIVPQTLPIRVYGRSRDELYFELNAIGYGVVSLYHTLIEEISIADFPESHALAKNILNLPVHQDILNGQLEEMIEALRRLI